MTGEPSFQKIMKPTIVPLLIAGIFLALPCVSCLADTTRPFDTSSSDPNALFNPYPKGMWDCTIYGSYAIQPSHFPIQTYSGTFGVSYYFANNWSFGVEFEGLSFDEPGGIGTAGRADMMLRTHLVNWKNGSLFSDFSLGLFAADHRFPAPGTYFNYTIRTGLGAMWKLTDNIDLLAGARYLHLSNAQLEGARHNPSFNAVEIYSGLLFKF